jgi:glutamin-(asparagin-)ase
VFIVRASRTGSGVVIRNGEQPDDKYDWIVTDDQIAQKARILMALALTKTNDPKALQRSSGSTDPGEPGVN